MKPADRPRLNKLLLLQDILWSALLTSDELPSYLARNQRALSRAYTYLTSWLQAHHLPYTPANAGHFVLVDFRKHVNAIADKGVLEKGEEPGRRGADAEESGRFKHEIVLLNRLVDGGVYLGPGKSRNVHSERTLGCNEGALRILL